MKYMGSKRGMLRRELASALNRNLSYQRRFVDLFCGTAAVSHHVAANYDVEVLAVDLQDYARVLALSVLERTEPVDFEPILSTWSAKANSFLSTFESFLIEHELRTASLPFVEIVDRHREFSSNFVSLPITRSYGGHYFSPRQSMILDAYRLTLKQEDPLHSLKLAALIATASMSASSPGHTAQPFQPTTGASKYLMESWNRDPSTFLANELRTIANMKSRVRGSAVKGDANEVASQLGEKDLAFIDPPYSEVQYSRFYHVLETVSLGDVGPVSGVGRYPSLESRAQSSYSRKSESASAFLELLSTLREVGTSAIITYPEGETSNGFSGKDLLEICEDLFRVRKQVVNGQFSTMGGSSSNRGGRKPSYELVLEISPKL